MATLKGIFDPKPPHQRNFLLENIQNVKIRSRLNNKKDDKPEDISVKRREIRLEPSSKITTNQGKHSNTKSNVNFRNSTEEDNRKYALQGKNDKNVCCCASEKRCSSRNRQQKISSRTMHYIHQENVPFEWTEMCPSLVSHRICHQGVQTEEYIGDVLSSRISRKNEDGPISIPRGDNKLNEIELPCGPPQEPGGRCKTMWDEFQPSTKPFQAKTRCRSRDSGSFGVDEIDSCQKVSGDCECEVASEQRSFASDAQPQPVSSKEATNTIDKIPGLETLKISSGGSLRKPPAGSSVLPPSYQKGVIPKYLARRKNEQLIRAAQPKAIDSNCPPGHVAMPDNERKETLDLILKNYNDLVTELNKMPVRTDTLKMKQRKIELEKQLDKLEEGIRVFSRSKVYIKLNE